MTLRRVEGEWGPASRANRAKDPRYSSGTDVVYPNEKGTTITLSNGGIDNKGFEPPSPNDMIQPVTFGSNGSANPVDDVYTVPLKRFSDLNSESTRF